MHEERDAMMLVRAELCERLATMQSFSRRAGARDLADSINSFRHLAAAYGLVPVARLAEALQRAIAQDLSTRGSCSTALYLDRLQDAIGCTRIDDQASEAMIASVSVRLDS